jgi:hypothetical protein
MEKIAYLFFTLGIYCLPRNKKRRDIALAIEVFFGKISVDNAEKIRALDDAEIQWNNGQKGVNHD